MLTYSPNGCSGQNWAVLQLEARSSNFFLLYILSLPRMYIAVFLHVFATCVCLLLVFVMNAFYKLVVICLLYNSTMPAIVTKLE